jgi:hypothetical protein
MKKIDDKNYLTSEGITYVPTYKAKALRNSK